MGLTITPPLPWQVCTWSSVMKPPAGHMSPRSCSMTLPPTKWRSTRVGTAWAPPVSRSVPWVSLVSPFIARYLFFSLSPCWGSTCPHSGILGSLLFISVIRQVISVSFQHHFEYQADPITLADPKLVLVSWAQPWLPRTFHGLIGTDLWPLGRFPVWLLYSAGVYKALNEREVRRLASFSG